jgi:hypothetical protein
MAAGFQTDLAGANSAAWSMVVTLRNALEQIEQYKIWLDGVGSAGLVALGMTSQDAAVLISAFADLNDLANVYSGKASTHVTGTYDYTTFAKQLTAYT